ncbi:MAG: hypothetical protein P4M09_17290 [Devosia sp.]|nr:hypothetical protein [Devosia sp.]
MATSKVTLGTGLVATGAKAGVRVAVPDGKDNVPVHIRGITTATVSIDGSIDGTNWLSLISKTADFIGTVPAMPYMRVNVTAWTSGSITALLFAAPVFGG